MDLFEVIEDYIRKEFKPTRVKFKGVFRRVIIINGTPYLTTNKNSLIDLISEDVKLVIGLDGDEVRLLVEYILF